MRNRETARVIAAPPFLFAGTLALGLLLNAFHPVAITSGSGVWRIVLAECVDKVHRRPSVPLVCVESLTRICAALRVLATQRDLRPQFAQICKRLQPLVPSIWRLAARHPSLFRSQGGNFASGNGPAFVV